MSDKQQTRRLSDVPDDDDDLEELIFRDHKVVAGELVLPVTSTLPPPPSAPKSDS